jgi:hypothetical protein
LPSFPPLFLPFFGAQLYFGKHHHGV